MLHIIINSLKGFLKSIIKNKIKKDVHTAEIIVINKNFHLAIFLFTRIEATKPVIHAVQPPKAYAPNTNPIQPRHQFNNKMMFTCKKRKSCK